MQNLPHEPGAAVAVHGSVSVEHHAGTEVVVRAPGQTMRLTDAEGRDLAACCSELFPSMCCGTGLVPGRPAMSRNIEHIVETHRLAQQRRSAGLPIWDRTVRLGDVFHNEAMSFEERRDAIVARVRASGWLDGREDDLMPLVDDLAAAENADDFDVLWDELYDHADLDRVWIETISRGGRR